MVCAERWLETKNGALIDTVPATAGSDIDIGQVTLRDGSCVSCVFSTKTYRVHKKSRKISCSNIFEYIGLLGKCMGEMLPHKDAVKFPAGIGLSKNMHIVGRCGEYLYLYNFCDSGSFILGLSNSCGSAVGYLHSIPYERFLSAHSTFASIRRYFGDVADIPILECIPGDERRNEIRVIYGLTGGAMKLEWEGNNAILTDKRTSVWDEIVVPDGVEHLQLVRLPDSKVKRRIYLNDSIRYIERDAFPCANIDGVIEFPDSVVAAPCIFGLIRNGITVSIGRGLAENWLYWQAAEIYRDESISALSIVSDMDTYNRWRIGADEGFLAKKIHEGKVIVRD